jgi:transcriptional regulator with GAF, ATPase, and Fis domain
VFLLARARQGPVRGSSSRDDRGRRHAIAWGSGPIRRPRPRPDGHDSDAVGVGARGRRRESNTARPGPSAGGCAAWGPRRFVTSRALDRPIDVPHAASSAPTDVGHRLAPGGTIDDRITLLCDLALSLSQLGDRDELLHQLTTRTAALAPGMRTGIMLVDRSGDLAFVAASDDAVVEIERYQERVNDGACYHAFRTGSMVAAEDLTSDDRWPGYRDRVLAVGARAVLGLPMHAFGQTIGVMNVYRPNAGPWVTDEVQTLRALTAIAAAFIVHHADEQEARSVRTNLEAAIDSRDLIGQAKGLIMAREGVGSDEAFDRLRERSQRANRKLRDVAAELVASTSSTVDETSAS